MLMYRLERQSSLISHSKEKEKLGYVKFILWLALYGSKKDLEVFFFLPKAVCACCCFLNLSLIY